MPSTTTAASLRLGVRWMRRGAFWPQRIQQRPSPGNFQMVVGAVLDNNGRPICCEMWPGNTADNICTAVVFETLSPPWRNKC
jgi:hypothetical protein